MNMTEPATSARTWRVMVADDHTILREGLAMLLAAQPDLTVVAQARTGREAVQLAVAHRPDVAVMDVSMPDLGGAEATEQIVVQSPHTRVLALTRHAEVGHLRRMLEAGATGYLLKRTAANVLVDAIRTVVQGGSHVDPTLAGALMTRSIGRVGAGAVAAATARTPLSEREEQVLRLIAWGKSNKEVASQLSISIKTAEYYKAVALEKLGLRSRTDILRHALAENWLGAEDAPE